MALTVRIVVLAILLVASPPAHAIGITLDEHSEAQRWVTAKFEGRPEPQQDRGYLLPLFKAGQLEVNSRQGHTLRIAKVSYAHGFNCPSDGTIKVHLATPAVRFSAVVGIDSNDITYYSSLGRGHVVVAVETSAREVYRSPVMHEGMEGTRVVVDLKGATDFTLRITGLAADSQWNQVNFVDPEVTLASKEKLELNDFPLGPLQRGYTVDPPFSFRYGGAKSRDLLNNWKVERSSRQLDTQRTEYAVTYKDPGSGLLVRCTGVAYQDYPTAEWTVYFKNTGTTRTPILEDIQAIDTRFEHDGQGEFVLHHNKGAPATPNDYQPYETTLGQNAVLHLGGAGGRPTNKDLSYFNLAWSGHGVILAVGWPGQWAAQFTRDSAQTIQVRGGQELTHLTLLPGEEIRTPLIVLQFWRGDWIRSQNIWRRWMMNHNMPRPGGKLPPPQMAANTSREYIEMTEATALTENMFIDRYLADGLKPDYFWMDAGWYPNHDSWINTGTWEVDSARFPHGLRAVSDHAHAVGVKIILWFEPERVTPGSWLYENHPEWLLTPPHNPGDQLYDDKWRLFNFGDSQARQWMTDHIDRLIIDQGVDLYRQDFNLDPLYFWRANDAQDRQGITEIRYVTGYLQFWDELRRRHPNMLIDSCASGGRRNDLETLRRAVPLTRSDYLLEPVEPISQQMQTYGIALWIPYFGTGTSGTDAYVFRSQMTPAIITSWDLRRDDLDESKMRMLIQQWREIASNYYGDYYPLTAYNMNKDVWAAMQFNRPEAAEGFVEVFRRSKSPYESARFKLQGLDPAVRYNVTNLDSAGSKEMSGEELMANGIEVLLKEAPGSALFTYKQMHKTAGIGKR